MAICLRVSPRYLRTAIIKALHEGYYLFVMLSHFPPLMRNMDSKTDATTGMLLNYRNGLVHGIKMAIILGTVVKFRHYESIGRLSL